MVHQVIGVAAHQHPADGSVGMGSHHHHRRFVGFLHIKDFDVGRTKSDEGFIVCLQVLLLDIGIKDVLQTLQFMILFPELDFFDSFLVLLPEKTAFHHVGITAVFRKFIDMHDHHFRIMPQCPFFCFLQKFPADICRVNRDQNFIFHFLG